MRAALRPPITYQYGDFVRALFAPPRARLGFLDLSGNSISGHVGTCLLPRASHMSSRSSVGGVPAIWAGDSALLEPRHLAHRSRVTLYAVSCQRAPSLSRRCRRNRKRATHSSFARVAQRRGGGRFSGATPLRLAHAYVPVPPSERPQLS
jgi:hypothetical protein